MIYNKFNNFLFEWSDFDPILESYDFDLNYVAESTKKNNKKKITKMDIQKAKKDAYLKILQSAQYRAAVTRMNSSQRQEVQHQIRNRIDDNIEDSREFLERNPYLTISVLTIIAIAGSAFLTTYAAGIAYDSIVDGAEFLQKSVETFFDNNMDIFGGVVDNVPNIVDLDFLDAVDITDITDIAMLV